MDLRKLVLATGVVLGSGFILTNVASSIILAYQTMQFSISSSSQITSLFGTLLFLAASIILVILGAFLVVGVIYFYRWGAPEGILSLGILLGSLYLLLLGVGSILLHPSIESMLLLLSAVFFMVGSAAYMSTTFDFKFTGSFMIFGGGILLATVLLNYPVWEIVFTEWDAPFLGPFMSLNLIEAILMIVAPAAVLVDLIVQKRKEKSTIHIFLPIITLIYGMSMFIGTLFLTLNLWNLLWKAPWLGPLYAVPEWVFGATVFWSVALMILAVGGIFLGVSSFMAFANVTSVLSMEEEFSQILPPNRFGHQVQREESTVDKYAALRALISSPTPTPPTTRKPSYLFTAKRKEEENDKKSF